jgi:hypothetical protein
MKPGTIAAHRFRSRLHRQLPRRRAGPSAARPAGRLRRRSGRRDQSKRRLATPREYAPRPPECEKRRSAKAECAAEYTTKGTSSRYASCSGGTQAHCPADRAYRPVDGTRHRGEVGKGRPVLVRADGARPDPFAPPGAGLEIAAYGTCPWEQAPGDTPPTTGGDGRSPARAARRASGAQRSERLRTAAGELPRPWRDSSWPGSSWPDGRPRPASPDRRLARNLGGSSLLRSAPLRPPRMTGNV